MEETREELEKVKEKIKRGDGKETLLEAVEEYEKKLMEKWLASNPAGAQMRMMFMPTELDQVREIKAILTNPNSTALDVYKEAPKEETKAPEVRGGTSEPAIRYTRLCGLVKTPFGQFKLRFEAYFPRHDIAKVLGAAHCIIVDDNVVLGG